ncbi:MAG: endonuclease VII domain-containing protein [Thaumarchaeota archaeon]|nr:endonuclease VII domain-containing protein [Nitrososphaerota archaeon]
MKWVLAYRRFGLTKETLRDLYEKQNGICAICFRSGTDKGGLVLDHDHKTNKIRGLLCYNCNIGLGHFKDDPALLELAKQYLSLRSDSSLAIDHLGSAKEA